LLTGEKIELRPVSRSDLKNQYQWRNLESFANLAAGSWSFSFNNTPLETMEASYEKNLTTVDKKEGCVFSIYTLDDEKHIGQCDYRDVNLVTRAATIGISIGDSNYWDHGYGTDAMRTLIRHLFRSMNLRRVQLDTWSGNHRAIKAYQKCGFIIEGRLRDNEYVDGSYYDTIVMGLLRTQNE
jgi:RimJ/RimL family protein N-acetyltransferase